MKTLTTPHAFLSSALVALIASACGGGGNTASTNSQPLAAESAANGAGNAARAPHDPARFLRRFDQNGNGALEIAELPERMQSRLGAADTNHDGTLAPEEMSAFREARKAEHFARMDANHDGAITADEAGAQRWTFLARADGDHDGRVTRPEMDQAHAAGMLHHGRGFGRHGGMGMGMMGMRERRAPDPAHLVQRFDQNGNGTLEVSELPERMAEHLGAADADHNGALSVDELKDRKSVV